jgi:succinate dehydrogenase/fumarate reductase flavoprotein subunit
VTEKRIQTDVLCVGAGIAGLMAGVRAAEKGAKVILAEKGHALHSGRGRGGNDHFWCWGKEIELQKSLDLLKEPATQPR